MLPARWVGSRLLRSRKQATNACLWIGGRRVGDGPCVVTGVEAGRAPQFHAFAALRCHSIIIDDLLNFKTVPANDVPGLAMAELSADVAAVCQLYEDVGARVRMEKVADYSPTQVVAGYQLDANVLRTPDAKYSDLSSIGSALRRRGFAKPREVESIVGEIPAFILAPLLHRLALSVFSASYAFARKLGMRHARVWPAVLRELQRALAILSGRSLLGRCRRCWSKPMRVIPDLVWCTPLRFRLLTSDVRSSGLDAHTGVDFMDCRRRRGLWRMLLAPSSRLRLIRHSTL